MGHIFLTSVVVVFSGALVMVLAQVPEVPVNGTVPQLPGGLPVNTTVPELPGGLPVNTTLPVTPPPLNGTLPIGSLPTIPPVNTTLPIGTTLPPLNGTLPGGIPTLPPLNETGGLPIELPAGFPEFG
ncbi:hepatitis A virus cellular receptor 1 isoform X2 [Folsomia candida]|uniref:hepatitis A virus cellular receptor 1 isoform X2 n=1 Tax=Folsomia candida TaxID=158441 RepID=UPI000B907852|nr:hepatitis A virus cellular receptor 1 isoform X2 [Folsomia candida]